MGDFCEDELANYVTLTELAITDKSEVFLVKNILTNKIYVKKHVGNYNINVYKLLKTIDSIHIPKIYELFEIDDKLIIIEEFINGLTLDEIRSKEFLIADKKVIDYMISLCEILEKLQKLNTPIIHKDIKPSNIIISNDGVLKLIDFDASKIYKGALQKDTTILGTKGYASPELLCFNKTDIRSDIYSIGVLMNVLTIGDYPENIESPSCLNPIIKKCTDLSPNNRYQNVTELRQALEDILTQINGGKNDWSIQEKNKKISGKTTLDNDFEKSNKILNPLKEESIRLLEFYKLIPGFRTATSWKIIVAILWYIFIAFGMFTQPIVATILLLLSLLYTNFLNLKEKLPLLKREEISLKIFGYVFYTLVIFLGLGMFLK